MLKSKALTAAVALAILATGTRVNAQTSTGRALAAIEKMVNAGNVSGAVKRLQNDYRFDDPAGLSALHRFSVSILRRGLHDPDPYEHLYAASALGAAGDPQGVKLLEAEASSPDPELRMAAMDGLADMGNHAAVLVLARIYHSSRTETRLTALQGLSQIDDPEAKSMLVGALATRDNATRKIAVEAVGRFRTADALPQLRALLAVEKDGFSTVTLAHAMLLLGDNSVVGKLQGVLQNETNIDVRAAAALALGDARDQGAQVQLKQTLVDQDTEVKMAAAAALTHYNDDAGLNVLRTAIESKDSATRSAAGQLLKHLDFSVARSTVLEALSSPDEGLRLAGVQAVGLLGGGPEVPVLANSLRQTHEPLQRANVAWALGRIARRECIPILMSMVLEPAPAVRHTAADALARTSRRLLDNSRAAAR